MAAQVQVAVQSEYRKLIIVFLISNNSKLFNTVIVSSQYILTNCCVAQSLSQNAVNEDPTKRVVSSPSTICAPTLF
jgi:hypothetical protein